MNSAQPLVIHVGHEELVIRRRYETDSLGHGSQPQPRDRVRDHPQTARRNGRARVRAFVQPYDATEPWGADAGGPEALMQGLDSTGKRLAHTEADLAAPETPQRLMDTAVARFGPVDTLVLNHARSQLGTLDALTGEALDRTWAVNVRASLLLVQAFAEQYRPHPHGGRVVLFTSEQHKGPAPAEIPYAATKGALQQIASQVIDAEGGFRRFTP